MSRTTDSTTRAPRNSDPPPHEGQEVEDHLTQEKFDNELENDLEVLLTQEELHEEQREVEERLMKAKKKGMMMMTPHQGDM